MPGGSSSLFGSGYDFSSVQPHGGGQAAGLGALAYTQGTDVHFGAGSYAPGGGDRELLGHELAHVVQPGAAMSDIHAAVGHYGQ